MPTAARLIAALSLAALALLVSQMIRPLMPESTRFGYFDWINAGLGLLVGWRVLGPRAGAGVAMALTNGLTAVAVLVFWGLFVQGLYEMWQRALMRHYDGPFEAIGGAFALSFEFALTALAPHVLAALVVGGCLAGLATETAQRRWR